MDILKQVMSLQPVIWQNPEKISFSEALERIEKEFKLSYNDIVEAENRLLRFAPLIKRLFPETEDGIIESPLSEVHNFKAELERLYGKKIAGRVFAKRDNELKVAGSIKARGGIYEVLKHTEEVALENGILSLEDDYSKLAEEKYKKLFSQYKIAVGSTGNLGPSIGIMASALGFQVDIHMSKDAKEWKKRLLRERGCNVIEYEEDYSKAVEEGRRLCQMDEKCYFVDDETCCSDCTDVG